jgi:membrane associated rhomboid family serine protease
MPLMDGMWHAQKTFPRNRAGVAASSRTFTFWLVVVQAVFLFLEIAIGGFAPVTSNPFLGPDVNIMSAMGAKNAALIVYKGQVFRWWTMVLVHVGIIHFLLNGLTELTMMRACEFAWGRNKVVFVFLATSLTAASLSCVGLPGAISPGASGAVCGIYGALAVHLRCEWTGDGDDGAAASSAHAHHQPARSALWRGLLYLVVILAVLTPWVDWAAHLGGVLSGVCLGLFLFAETASSTVRLALRRPLKWGGLAAYVLLTGALIVATFTAISPAPELADLPLVPG